MKSRTHKLNVRMNEHVYQILEELAENLGMSRSRCIEQLIKISGPKFPEQYSKYIIENQDTKHE